MFKYGPPNTIIGYPFDDGFGLDFAQGLQGHLLLQDVRRSNEMDMKKGDTHLRSLPYRQHPYAHRTVGARGRCCGHRLIVVGIATVAPHCLAFGAVC